MKASTRKSLTLTLAAVAAALGIAIIVSSGPGRSWWLSLQSTQALRETFETRLDPLVGITLAERLRKEGAGPEAWTIARRAAHAISSDDRSQFAGRAWALAGYLASCYGSEEEAETLLGRSAALKSRHPLLPLGQGIVLVRRQESEEAVKAFEEAVRLSPGSAEAWTRLGTALLEAADPERARVALTRASELAPRSAAHLVDLGEALTQTRRFREAADTYERALKLFPGDPDLLGLLAAARARAARTEPEYEEAALALRSVLQADMQDVDTRLMLAGLHMRFNRLAPARAELEVCLQQRPLNADAWFNLATICEQQGDTAAAREAMSRFTRLITAETTAVRLTRLSLKRPKDARLFLQLSLALRSTGKYAAALKAIQRAAELAPHDPEIARNVAGARSFFGAAGDTLPSGNQP